MPALSNTKIEKAKPLPKPYKLYDSMIQKLAMTVVAVTTLWTSLANGQDVSSCPAYDLSCIEQEFVLACRTEESTHESCMKWLRELEASSIADAPNARLTAASAYTALSGTGETQEESVRFQARALQILRELVAENPANVQALLSLSVAAATTEERVAILKRIVEVDPSYAFGWEALANVVDDSEEPEDLVESAQYLSNAYNVLEGEKKWAVASNVVSRYRRAGSIDRADDFVERVRRDFELDRKIAEFEDVAQVPPSLRAETLQAICSASAIAIFGGTICIDVLRTVVEFVENSPNSPWTLTAAEDAAQAMVLAAASGWRIDNEIEDWRSILLNSIDQVVDSGKVSAPLYVAKARLALNKEQRLSAMRNAARLAPLDGEIALRLGLAYFDLERWEEAATELSRARNLLPEERHELIEGFLERALNARDNQLTN